MVVLFAGSIRDCPSHRPSNSADDNVTLNIIRLIIISCINGNGTFLIRIPSSKFNSKLSRGLRNKFNLHNFKLYIYLGTLLPEGVGEFLLE